MWQRRAWHVFTRFLGTIAALTVFLVIAVRAQQYALRQRAERLSTDLAHIEVGKTKLAEVQDLVRNWLSDIDGDGSCSEAQCSEHIGVEDFSYKHANLFPKRLWLLQVYRALGGRVARADARISIKNGIVTDKQFMLSIGVLGSESKPSEKDAGYLLFGRATTRQSLSPPRYDPSHPSYWVGWPGGCEICVAMEVESTPDAPLNVRRLEEFDFSCATRWLNPCRDRGDIMPEAWAEAKREGM